MSRQCLTGVKAITSASLSSLHPLTFSSPSPQVISIQRASKLKKEPVTLSDQLITSPPLVLVPYLPCKAPVPLPLLQGLRTLKTFPSLESSPCSVRHHLGKHPKVSNGYRTQHRSASLQPLNTQLCSCCRETCGSLNPEF